jgi:hypothetical protein
MTNNIHILNFKNIENKINDYIKKELPDKNLTLEYIKINRDIRMSNTTSEFRKQFDFLYNIFKYLKNSKKETDKDNLEKEINKKIKNYKIVNIDKNIDSNEEILDIITKKYNVIKTIKIGQNSYYNSLYVITEKNNKKKYFLKIFGGTYFYNDFKMIENFINESTRLKLASKKNISPKIKDFYTVLYNFKREYYDEDYDDVSMKYKVNMRNILITEYIEGMNFKEYINTELFNSQDLDEVKNLMKKLHSIGIFHGSITSTNIIYDKNYKKNSNKFKFVDFSRSNTCDNISKESLETNIESLDKLSIKYQDQKYLHIYISIYYVLNDKLIKILL